MGPLYVVNVLSTFESLVGDRAFSEDEPAGCGSIRSRLAMMHSSKVHGVVCWVQSIQRSGLTELIA